MMKRLKIIFAKVNKVVQAALGKAIILSDHQIFPIKPKMEVSCAMICKGNAVLLLKRSKKEDQSHAWCIPGGKKENKETPVETMRRELKEELGENAAHALTVSEEPLFSTYAWFGKSYYLLHIFDTIGDVEISKIKPRPTEHSAAQFFTASEFPRAQLILGQYEILQRYFADFSAF